MRESEITHNLNEFAEYLSARRYSDRTIENYVSVLKYFFAYFPDKNDRSIGLPEIDAYNRDVILYKNYSASYQNILISALKVYFTRTHNRNLKLDKLERPKIPRKIPVVLSQSEIRDIICNTNNLKHKTILSIIYSAGLRISEVTNLNLKDIDSKRMVIHIRSSKGNKDRMINLSEKLLLLLREYYRQYKPQIYLFEGWYQRKYSTRSIGNILKNSVAKSGIKKSVTVHTLRHSFATHLVESGTDIHLVQCILGHSNIKTTTIYLHVRKEKIASIRSPFDDL